MKRWAKFLLLAVGSGVALLIVAGIFLKIYFNEARLRALILPPVREALGREVDISSISIDLFRGIRIGGLIVKEADGETNFISVDELGLSYSLMPLLQKRLEIGRVWLEKPTINVRKNLDGSFNYADLKLLKSSGKVVENGVETQVGGRGDRTPVVLPLALAVQRCDVSGITLTFIDDSGELPKVDFNADLTSKLDLGDLRPESIMVTGDLKFSLTAEYKSLTPQAHGTISFDRHKVVFGVDFKQQNQACTISGSVSDYLEPEPILVLDLNAPRLDLAYLVGLGQQFVPPAPAKAQAISPPKTANAIKYSSEPPSPPALIVSGKINVKQALYEGYRVDAFLLHYRYEGALLTLSDLSGRLAEGEFSGDAEIKPFRVQPEFKGFFALSDLNVATLMVMAAPKVKDSFYGVGAGEFKFSGHGATSEGLRKSLSLDGQYSLRQAGMRKLPITVALSQLLDLPQMEEVDFAEFAGNLRIRDGQLQLNSNWHGDQLSGNAIGDIGLDGGLNLPVTLVLNQDLSAKLARRYTWVKESFNQQDEAEIELYLAGTLSQPELRLNNEKVVQSLQRKLEEKILRKLEKRLRDKHGESGGQADATEGLLRRILQ